VGCVSPSNYGIFYYKHGKTNYAWNFMKGLVDHTKCSKLIPLNAWSEHHQIWFLNNRKYLFSLSFNVFNVVNLNAHDSQASSLGYQFKH
jgi:hypothetical protein